MYDEDQQNHFRNIGNQEQILDEVMEADKNSSIRQRLNTKSSLFQSQDFTVKNFGRSSTLCVGGEKTGNFVQSLPGNSKIQLASD